MSDQQLQGLVLFLLGIAALIISVGVAWVLARITRRTRVESMWLVSGLSFLLFVVGVALCWFGVSALLGG
jgi:hypothetical protein